MATLALAGRFRTRGTLATPGQLAAALAIAAFLAQTRADGATFQEAIEANLDLVLERARPFADDPSPPASKKELLVERAQVEFGRFLEELR